MENRTALRVRVGNTRSAHLVCLCFESFCGKLGAHLGSFGKFPKQARNVPAPSRAREKCLRASSQCIIYPKYSSGRVGFGSSLKKLGTCFESCCWFPITCLVIWLLRVRHEKSRGLLRVDPHFDPRMIFARIFLHSRDTLDYRGHIS